MTGILEFVQSRGSELLARTAEHLLLTGVSTCVALVLGVAIATFAFHFRHVRQPVLTAVSLLQTIPGLALLVMMLALFRTIGMIPTLAALVLYSLLPIARNTLTGLLSVPPVLAEAAIALGMTPTQRLRYVRIPFAIPSLVAGLRIAAVQCVGLATLAAFVGAGGLGQFINRGLFLSDTRLILLGAIPAALIAMMIDLLIHLIQYGSFSIDAPTTQRRLALVSALGLLGLTAVFTLHYLPPLGHAARGDRITVSSKNFTEQLIVAEIVAQTIEQKTQLQVERRFGLGGTSVLHSALVGGDADVAVEYTGTALMAVLNQPAMTDSKHVFATVRDAYAQRFKLHWFAPLGFNNSYVLAVRANDPRFTQSPTITSLTQNASDMAAGFDFEFAERSDGYAGLEKRYHMRLREVRDMHPDLLYDALANGQVDVISSSATDGRLDPARYMLLKDDGHFFPPYDAAIVVRQDALTHHPELEKTLAALSGRIDTETMRRLNAAVDEKHMSVAKAATFFLNQNRP